MTSEAHKRPQIQPQSRPHGDQLHFKANPHQPDLKPLREPGQPAKRAAAPWRRCPRNQPASKTRPLRNHSLRVTTLPVIAAHQLLVRPHAVPVRDSARQPSVAIRGVIQTNRNLRPLDGIDGKIPPEQDLAHIVRVGGRRPRQIHRSPIHDRHQVLSRRLQRRSRYLARSTSRSHTRRRQRNDTTPRRVIQLLTGVPLPRGTHREVVLRPWNQASNDGLTDIRYLVCFIPHTTITAKKPSRVLGIPPDGLERQTLPTNQRCHAAIGAPGGVCVVRSPASDMGTSW